MHLVSELFLDQVSVLAVPDEYFVHLNGSETKTEVSETSRDGFLGYSAASFWSFSGSRAGHALSNSRPRSRSLDFGVFWVGFCHVLVKLVQICCRFKVLVLVLLCHQRGTRYTFVFHESRLSMTGL